MSYQRIGGTPTLVDRSSYGNLPPRSLGGVWDTIVNIAKGGSDVYQSTKAQPQVSAPSAPFVPTPAAPAPSTFQKYLPMVAIGGLALGAVVLLRRKK